MKELKTKLKGEMGIQGKVEIEKYDTRTGELVEKREGNNLLLDDYLNSYFEDGYPLLAEEIFDTVFLGDDDTEADRTQTGLQGSELASKSRDSHDDSQVNLLSQDGSQSNNFTEHNDDVNSVSFHPTENLAISGSEDNTAKIWEYDTDAGTTNELCSFTEHGSTVTSVSFHPDETKNLAISCSRDDTAKIWEYDTDAGTTTELCEFTGHDTSDVTSVSFHPDETKNLAISGGGFGDETARIWEYDTDAGTTTELCEFTGHNDNVESVAFHPTEDIVISGSGNTAKIWEYDTDAGTTTELINFTDGGNPASFHPDETKNIAISSSFDTVKIWEYDIDAGTTTELCSFTEHNDSVTSVSFHPDETKNIAISCSKDDTAKIWEYEIEKQNTISANGEWVFEAGEGTGTIREIYLQGSFNGSESIARKVISPEIVKDEYHEIILKWTIEISKPDEGWSGTLSEVGIEGENIDYELTLGNQSLAQHTGFEEHLPYNINEEDTSKVYIRTFEMNEEPSDLLGLFQDDHYEDEIDRVNTYQILKTYSASDYKIEYRLTLDVDDSNDADIGGIRIENDGTDPSLRVLFDPKLTKTDTYRLHFDFEFTLNPNPA